MSDPASLNPKVLLIGWDAADWKVITPLLEEGKMPNLERLIDEGVKGNLATIQPALSPMLWTSIATGKRAYKHGIHGFSEPDPQSGGIRPITNLSRKTKAIWNILNQEGKKCNVVGWWPSHPAEPLNGVMVSNHYQQANGKLEAPWPMRPGTVHPQRLTKPLSELRIHPQELEGNDLLPFVPDGANVDQKKDRRLMSVAKIIAECSGIHAAATAIMQLEPWDFMGVYYDAIDHFCHGFMKYHPPCRDWIPEEDFERYKEVVTSGYRYHDLMLGALLALAGKDTTVILMSDHGFHPDHLRPKHIPNEPAGPAAEHREFGIFVMKGPGVKKDDLVFGASLLDIAPTILTLFDLPIGEDMDGKPLVNAFESVPKLKTIPSWDVVKGDDGSHPSNSQLDPADSQLALKQLIDLGYIEKPDENQEKAVAETVRELQYNLARAYIDTNHYHEASEILNQLWKDWPDESRFGIKLLHCQLPLGKTKEARNTINQIRANKKRYSKKAREELKALNEKLKNDNRKPEDLDDRERHQIRKLRAKAGVNLTALTFLEAQVCSAEGKDAEALKLLEITLTAETANLPGVHRKIAECQISLKNWHSAEEHFLKVLELNEEDPTAWLGICRCNLHRRRNLQAASAALKSIGLQFHNPFGHYYYGVALHRCGQIELSVKALNMAVAQNPNFPKVYHRLATIARNRLKDLELAQSYEQKRKEAAARIQKAKISKRIKVENTHKEAPNFTPAVPFVANQRFRKKPFSEVITIVSGLPRSGTSMMMQILNAGGVPIYADDIRSADQNNPKGYFEAEKVKSLMRDRSWIKDSVGRAVKIVAPLIPYLPLRFHYRIIFMNRNLDEIIASQTAMLSNLGEHEGSPDISRLRNSFQQQILQVQNLISHNPNFSSVVAPYREFVRSPKSFVSELIKFIDPGNQLNLDMVSMIGAVDTTLYRHRK